MKTILLLTSVAMLALTKASSAQIIYPADSDFQSPALGAGHFVVGDGYSVAGGDSGYPSTSTPWYFLPSSGVSPNQGPDETGIASNGGQNLNNASGTPVGQAAFLQNDTYFSQTLTLAAGTYSVSFDWEGRTPVSYQDAQNQTVTTGQDTVEVSLNLGGPVIFDGTPGSSSFDTQNFQSMTTASFTWAGGPVNLVFSGISNATLTGPFTDNMTFIDNIQVNVDPTPEPSTSGLIALGGVALFIFLRKLKSSKE